MKKVIFFFQGKCRKQFLALFRMIEWQIRCSYVQIQKKQIKKDRRYGMNADPYPLSCRENGKLNHCRDSFGRKSG
ncbi:hypothetical protein [uncultured Ruminococcus sp.]|uniref:hypothetical protein n=1 Tax=uncultured Ruminococcus sp. TaxID=165186 RepID=UPI00266BD601|nr:hypothetical protein [uncultured Ruminococcus sp.]